MSENISITMSAEDVTILAAVFPNPQDWLRVSYNGTALLVPGDLYNVVNAIDIVAARKSELIAFAAARRYDREIGGIVVNGAAIATDRQSQALINGAYNMATNVDGFTTQWKVNSTTFVTLNSEQIVGIAQAVGAHVAGCFAIEATTVAGINGGTITTRSQVAQAFS